MTEMNLAAIVGSLRATSANRVVFQAAVELAGPDVRLAEVSLVDVPLYNGDVEAAGDPPAVTAMKRAVEAADGLILFTPEYNRSIPAVTKNAIDWLSRHPGDSPLSRSVVGVVAATPGRHDASGVRAHLVDSLSRISAHFHENTLGIASVGQKVSDGQLVDVETSNELARWLAEFAKVVDEHR